MAHAGLKPRDLANALGVSTRTIENWIARKGPTMPTDLMQANLRRILPTYADEEGDPVEVAIRRSELAPFRRTEVLLAYQRALHDQALEDQRLAEA